MGLNNQIEKLIKEMDMAMILCIKSKQVGSEKSACLAVNPITVNSNGTVYGIWL